MKKEIYRSPERKICGLCSGLADYLNLDVTIVRLLVALIAFYTAVIPALIIYFIVALIVPEAPENYNQIYNNTAARLTKGRNKKLLGVCSGFSERFNCDVMIIRALFVLCFLFFGTGLFAYIICAVIMPESVEPYNYQQSYGNTDSYAQNYQQNGYDNGYQQNNFNQNGQQPPTNN